MTQQESIRLILAKQADAIAALRRSSDAFDDAIQHMHDVMTAIGAANRAQGDAIDAALAANEAALRLIDGAAQ